MGKSLFEKDVLGGFILVDNDFDYPRHCKFFVGVNVVRIGMMVVDEAHNEPEQNDHVHVSVHKPLSSLEYVEIYTRCSYVDKPYTYKPTKHP